MNNKSIFMVVAIAPTMASGIAATMASAVVPAVYADSANGRSDFGKKASDDLANDGQMGEHSSDPSGDGKGPEDRTGIGNVFNSGDPKDAPDSKHPSDTINKLCSLDPSNSACTDEGDPNDK